MIVDRGWSERRPDGSIFIECIKAKKKGCIEGSGGGVTTS